MITRVASMSGASASIKTYARTIAGAEKPEPPLPLRRRPPFQREQGRSPKMFEDRPTLIFCGLTLIMGMATFLLHLSPVYVGIPMIAAVVCALRKPWRTLIEMFFGGRR